MAGRAPRILVTRPEPGASRTAAALKEAGFEPVILPVTEITPLPVEASVIADASQIDAIAVTSANALRHAPDSLLRLFERKPLFAVGQATAAAAKTLGFGDVHIADGDADALAQLIDDQSPKSAHFLYLCGRVRTGGLETELEASGRRFTLAEVYDSKIVIQLTQKIMAVWRLGAIDAVLVHAGTSAEALAMSLPEISHTYPIDKTTIFVISGRAAKPLDPIKIGPIIISDAPTDASLLDAVRTRLMS